MCLLLCRSCVGRRGWRWFFTTELPGKLIVDLQYYIRCATRVIHNFKRLYSILSYYKIHRLYSLCSTIYPHSLFVLHAVICTSSSSTLMLCFPSSLSPVVTTSLFSISVNLFLFCYILKYFVIFYMSLLYLLDRFFYI